MDEDLPAVLLIGGGEGMGPIEATARALGDLLNEDGIPTGQILVICGRNKKLANKLSSIKWKIPVKVFIIHYIRTVVVVLLKLVFACSLLLLHDGHSMWEPLNDFVYTHF